MKNKTKNTTFYSLLISNMSNIFGFALFVPLYAVYVSKLGQSPQNGSYVWAAHTLVIGILVLLVGRIEDHQSKGYLKALMFGNFLQISGIFIFLVTSSFYAFSIGLMTYSIGVAILAPSWYSLFAGSISKKHSAKGWSFSQGGGALAGAGGAAIGGIVYSNLGFNGVFTLALIFHCIGFIFSVIAANNIHKTS